MSTRIIVTLVMLTLLANMRLVAADLEAQAAFRLKNGWVEVVLRKEGKPVANATIQIMNENGVKFGEGETGDEGETAFPMPAGASFVVEIKADTRTADPIRLYKKEASVEPARVLLSYGLRPCCRSAKTRDEPNNSEPTATPTRAADPEPTRMGLLARVSAGIVGVGLVAMIVWRRQRTAARSA